MGSTTAAASTAMTCSCEVNHLAPRSTEVVAVITWPICPRSHTAPSATHRPAAAKTSPTAPPTTVPTMPTSVHALAGVEEEVDHGRRRPDEECGEGGDEHGAPSGERLLVVLRVRPEGPHGGAHHEPGEGRHERPSAETVRQLLQHRPTGQAAGVGCEGHVGQQVQGDRH